MKAARVAIFDEPPQLKKDDDRRVASLRGTLSSQPGFVAGYHLWEEETGRMMSVTIWESQEAMETGEAAVRNRPAEDQRGIRPSRTERWVVEADF